MPPARSRSLGKLESKAAIPSPHSILHRPIPRHPRIALLFLNRKSLANPGNTKNIQIQQRYGKIEGRNIKIDAVMLISIWIMEKQDDYR
jgi:hypothetical protein